MSYSDQFQTIPLINYGYTHWYNWTACFSTSHNCETASSATSQNPHNEYA